MKRAVSACIVVMVLLATPAWAAPSQVKGPRCAVFGEGFAAYLGGRINYIEIFTSNPSCPHLTYALSLDFDTGDSAVVSQPGNHSFLKFVIPDGLGDQTMCIVATVASKNRIVNRSPSTGCGSVPLSTPEDEDFVLYFLSSQGTPPKSP